MIFLFTHVYNVSCDVYEVCSECSRTVDGDLFKGLKMADQSEFHGSEVDKEVVQTQKSEGEKVEQSVRKREVKLTAKGLMAKLDILQKQRKLKFDKASQLKRTIQEYMSNRESNHEVKGVFEKFKIQCKEAKESHESLIVLLPDEEREA